MTNSLICNDGVKCTDCKRLRKVENSKVNNATFSKEKLYQCGGFLKEAYVPESIINKPMKCKLFKSKEE